MSMFGFGSGGTDDDEEEEEEEGPHMPQRPAPRVIQERQSGHEVEQKQKGKDSEDEQQWQVLDAPRIHEIDDDEFDVPGDEDVVELVGNAMHGAWTCTEGLRQRRARPSGASSMDSSQGGLNLNEDPVDDSAFVFSSPQPDRTAEQFGLWRQLFLVLLVSAGVVATASNRKPQAESFNELRSFRYGGGGNSTERRRDWYEELGLPILLDRSLSGRVAWSSYVDHGPFAFGRVLLKAKVESAKTDKSKPALEKVYEHKYLGVFGTWVPLPYLPQPGTKKGMYGVGMCLLGRCVCVPNPKKGTDANGGTTSKHEKHVKPGIECLRFQGGKSAALNVMAVPNLILFGLWQFPKYWGPLGAHATISMANLSRGRLWTLLTFPFSHRTWGEAFHTAVLLTNAIDSFDRASVSFVVFFFLYIAGSWAAWLARGVIYRRVLLGDASSFYTQEWGSAGGLSAQLLFLARIRPEERFQFSMYFIPIPVNLSAWQSCFAHVALDVVVSKGFVQRQVLAHLAAWAVGWWFAGAWLQHT